MKIKITLMEAMLGTGCANPDVYREHVAKNAPDGAKVEEEALALSTDEQVEKGETVFARDDDGVPMLFDYQIKGFFKESLGVLLDYIEKDCKIGKAKLSRWTSDKIIDNILFITPRRIRLNLPAGTEVGQCVRPLRCKTMKGERVALAASEEVPAGTTFEFEVIVLNDDLLSFIPKCLDYAKLKGFGQWRNSGKGRAIWEEIKG